MAGSGPQSEPAEESCGGPFPLRTQDTACPLVAVPSHTGLQDSEPRPCHTAAPRCRERRLCGSWNTEAGPEHHLAVSWGPHAGPQGASARTWPRALAGPCWGTEGFIPMRTWTNLRAACEQHQGGDNSSVGFVGRRGARHGQGIPAPSELCPVPGQHTALTLSQQPRMPWQDIWKSRTCPPRQRWASQRRGLGTQAAERPPGRGAGVMRPGVTPNRRFSAPGL